MAPTPVTILTGFLGSGKTTLLNRILRGEGGRRIGVLINDFGDVNIDARLVAGIEGDAISLTNGCVCCSMRGGLVTSTLRLLDRREPPRRVVVEASGIADPLGIIAAFGLEPLRERTRLDGVITLVDAENARNPRLDRQLVEDGLRAADIAVLNKIDLVDERERASLREWILAMVPGARILEAVGADVPLDIILDLEREEANEISPHDHDHHHGFATWTYRTDCSLAYRPLHDLLRALPPDVFRAKGIVRLADAPAMRFAAQVVGRRASIDLLGPREGAERGTEIVFIGRSGSLDEDALRAQLDACATDAIPLLTPEGLRRLRGAGRWTVGMGRG